VSLFRNLKIKISFSLSTIKGSVVFAFCDVAALPHGTSFLIPNTGMIMNRQTLGKKDRVNHEVGAG